MLVGLKIFIARTAMPILNPDPDDILTLTLLMMMMKMVFYFCSSRRHDGENHAVDILKEA